jgi:hypothetical protein
VPRRRHAGRGRQGRSMVLRRPEPDSTCRSWCAHVWPRPAHEEPKYADYAGSRCRRCQTRSGRRPGCPRRIKWPNDVVIERRKLAGILVEAVNYGETRGIRGPRCRGSTSSRRRFRGAGAAGNEHRGRNRAPCRSCAGTRRGAGVARRGYADLVRKIRCYSERLAPPGVADVVFGDRMGHAVWRASRTGRGHRSERAPSSFGSAIGCERLIAGEVRFGS